MLSIHAISNVSQAVRYYVHMEADHTGSTEDYYATGERGYFAGGGVASMGLSGPVSIEDFESLAAGRTPLGDVQNAGSTDRKVAWDLTFSTPKSVSVLWATAGKHTREQIQAAHDHAIDRALEFMQNHAAKTRRGSGSISDEDRYEKVRLVAAIYRHGTSREMDPQLHSHAICFNAVVRQDGTVGALVSHGLYEWKMAGGVAYRAELANNLQRLGYCVERDGKSFHVIGVPQELCNQFSKRRLQIEAALKEHGARSAKASEIATLSTRAAKRSVDREVLRKAWQHTAKEISPNWSPNQCLNQPKQEHVLLNRKTILNKMTQQNSTFSHAQLYATVGIERQIHGNITDIEKYAGAVKADDKMVSLVSHHGVIRFTTKEMQTLEAQMVERAEKMSKTTTHVVDPGTIKTAIESRATLSDEQRKAVEHITKGNDLACVTGDAGTGKSFMLSVARKAWEAEGFRVRGSSLSGKAAQELQQSSGIQSTTLKRLEMDSRGYMDEQGQKYDATDKLNNRDILVVDEAGMSGSRQIAALLQDAERAHAKVVLIGDSRQLQAISAGAAFRAINERIGSASLVDIRRQEHEADRQAVRDFRDGRADEALQNLEKRGRIHESETSRLAKEETGRAVAEDLAAGKCSLGLAGTRQEVNDVNEYARVAAREKSLVVGQEVTVSTSNGERHFAEGDRVLFCRNNKTLDVKNGDLCTVTSICERDGSVHMIVRLDRGGDREVDTHKYDHLDHGYCITVHKVQGSTVDRAHVLASDNGMSSREWSYVAASRAKEETHIHADMNTLQELAPAWSKARQKDVSLDYQLAEEQEYEKPCDKEREAHVQEPIFELMRNN